MIDRHVRLMGQPSINRGLLAEHHQLSHVGSVVLFRIVVAVLVLRLFRGFC